MYGYRCLVCGKTQDDPTRNASILCCYTPMKRDYRSVQLGASAFTPHFNFATGRYVSTDREFTDALKRSAEDNSRLTGVDHSYTPIYPSEMAALAPRTETESVEASRKGWHDKLQTNSPIVP